LNGKKVRLVIQTPRIIEGRDEALEELVGKARSLRDAGKIDEAIEELQPLIAEAICYPPAMLTLANLLRMKDRLDEAEDLLTMLVDITPDQPVVLLNLAGLYLQRGDIDRVKQCVEQLECCELTDEINDMSRLIKKQID
jgi:predicted Zn-dependent protease